MSDAEPQLEQPDRRFSKADLADEVRRLLREDRERHPAIPPPPPSPLAPLAAAVEQLLADAIAQIPVVEHIDAANDPGVVEIAEHIDLVRMSPYDRERLIKERGPRWFTTTLQRQMDRELAARKR